MNSNTLSIISISFGSFLVGGSLGLALGMSKRCELCENSYKDWKVWADWYTAEEVEVEEETDIVEEEIVEESDEDSLIAVNNDIYEDLASTYITETLGEGDTDGDNVSEPYVISRDSYENEYLDYHKENLVYFVKDEVLSDDHDEIVEQWIRVIGDEALISFGEGSDDEDVVFVRNHRMRTDFEIVREDQSYAENVLGTKEDTQEYLEAKKFFGLDVDEE